MEPPGGCVLTEKLYFTAEAQSSQSSEYFLIQNS